MMRINSRFASFFFFLVMMGNNSRFFYTYDEEYLFCLVDNVLQL